MTSGKRTTQTMTAVNIAAPIQTSAEADGSRAFALANVIGVGAIQISSATKRGTMQWRGALVGATIVMIEPGSAVKANEFRGNEVRADGGCLYCAADQGETHRPGCTRPSPAVANALDQTQNAGKQVSEKGKDVSLNGQRTPSPVTVRNER